MLVEEQVHAGEVVSEIWRAHELLLLLDPALLVGHVPVELPELARLLEAGAAVGGQLQQLLVRRVQVRHAVTHHLGVARLVVCGQRSSVIVLSSSKQRTIQTSGCK
jgi:hypothetical protein